MPGLIPLETVTFTSSASSVVFNNGGDGLPQDYTGLHVRIFSNGDSQWRLRMNDITSAVYNFANYGYAGGASYPENYATQNFPYAVCLTGNSTNTVACVYTMDIYNYAQSTFTTIIGKGGNVNGATSYPQTEQRIIVLRSTASITKIELYASSGTFNAGTTVTLYGWK